MPTSGKIKYYLRIIRPVNLFMVAFTFYAVRYTVFEVFLGEHLYDFPISNLNYFIFTLSTVLIAASGNVINDIKDVEIDRANKKVKRVVMRKISIKAAYNYYYLLLVLSVVSSVYFAFAVGAFYLVFIQLFTLLALHFYSPHLKCTKLLGNITIAFITSIIPVVILVYFYAADSDYTFQAKLLVPKIPYVLIGYTLFSFFINLMREISKDVEDKKGDKALKCKTIAVRWKLSRVKTLLHILNFITIAIISFMGITLMNTKYYVFGTAILIIPMLLLIETMPRIISANERKKFKKLSAYLKLKLFLGVLFLFLLYFV